MFRNIFTSRRGNSFIDESHERNKHAWRVERSVPMCEVRKPEVSREELSENRLKEVEELYELFTLVSRKHLMDSIIETESISYEGNRSEAFEEVLDLIDKTLKEVKSEEESHYRESSGSEVVGVVSREHIKSLMIDSFGRTETARVNEEDDSKEKILLTEKGYRKALKDILNYIEEGNVV